MQFSISSLVSALDSYQLPPPPPSFAVGLDMGVSAWWQGQYGKCHVIIYLSHILLWLFSSINFYMAGKIFEQLANIFVSSLVSKIYQTMPICTMTLEIVCKIYTKTLIFEWRFLFNTTYTFELIIPFQVI
jgi:hypothetical protein